ncbi:unnamed protein product [Allacma fusca]|uniref:Uncharacterized protein n=1 Tax=Allacma fusca TaxID=39272 RepID=A0A8J2L0U8_9HEXA|nr:unnamed protein product [Allacma fusca]
MDDNNSKRQGTRVFKKSSPNGKITVYLGKRDFVDHLTHVDPIGSTKLKIAVAAIDGSSDSIATHFDGNDLHCDSDSTDFDEDEIK